MNEAAKVTVGVRDPCAIDHLVPPIIVTVGRKHMIQNKSEQLFLALCQKKSILQLKRKHLRDRGEREKKSNTLTYFAISTL